jgi:hypothetical protein
VLVAQKARRQGGFRTGERVGPVEFRLQGRSNSRGNEVIRSAAVLLGWQPR